MRRIQLVLCVQGEYQVTNCYLCESSAEVYGQDYGRRKIVHCTNCGYYEVTNTALSKIQEPDLPNIIKTTFESRVKQINNSGGNAEIVLVDETLKVQTKHA
jgi:uncharacterized Zn finger protein